MKARHILILLLTVFAFAEMQAQENKTATNEFTVPNILVLSKYEPIKVQTVSAATIVREMKFEIFSRWGNPVFSTTDIVPTWDGQSGEGKKRSPVAEGTYYYSISAELGDGRTVTQSGFLNVIQ